MMTSGTQTSTSFCLKTQKIGIDSEKVVGAARRMGRVDDSVLEYHVPKDRANALRKEMIIRKQGKEDVVQYIADKGLPCLEMNPTAPTLFSQMRSFIIEGMIPEIKATILHEDNPNFDALIQNTSNIEKGLKETGQIRSKAFNDHEIHVLNTEVNVRTLTETISKLLNKFDETNENILGLKHKSAHPRKDGFYDRYGRRVVDRSRDSSKGSNRSYSRDRDWFRGNRCR
jgi:hypothetical protein